MVHSKEKGNIEERKQAKQLGVWIFDDPQFIRKSEGSGSTRIVWSGDIHPVKPLPEIWKNHWPFHIEIKKGYEDHIPSPWKRTQMEKWVRKCFDESRIHNQQVIWLITQFPNKSALLSTNYCIPTVPFQICWVVDYEGTVYYFYTYMLKDLMLLNFYDVFASLFEE